MGADPNDATAAFAEYAADPLWIPSHLGQLAGVALMVAALIIVGAALEQSGRRSLVQLAGVGAICSLSLAATLQAVDGVALKAAVDSWASAPPTTKEIAFEAALAIRRIEAGLASILSISLGVTATLYGAALFGSRRFPRWLGALGLLGGIPTVLAGVAIAFGGFSTLAMMINMPANVLLLVWMCGLGAFLWQGSVRRAGG